MKMQDYLIDSYCKEIYPSLVSFLNEAKLASFYHVLSLTTCGDSEGVKLDEPYDACVKRIEGECIDHNLVSFREIGDAQNALISIADDIRDGKLLPYKWMRQTSFTVVTIACASNEELDTMMNAFDGMSFEMFRVPKVYAIGGHAILVFNTSTLNSDVIGNDFRLSYVRMIAAVIAEQRARYSAELQDLKAERARLQAQYDAAIIEVEKYRQQIDHGNSSGNLSHLESTPLYKLF